MVLEEQPAKVAEAVKLFLQGLGYIMRPRKAASTQVKTIEVQSQFSSHLRSISNRERQSRGWLSRRARIQTRRLRRFKLYRFKMEKSNEEDLMRHRCRNQLICP